MLCTGTIRTTTATARQAASASETAEDISETKNLAEEMKGRVGDLKRKLQTWRLNVLARMPIPNPNYDPKRAAEWWSTRTGKPIDSDSRKRFPATEKDL